MQNSKNYNFYLPSRDVDDIVDVNQLSENFQKIDTEMAEMLKGKGVDQTYKPESPNPQSGKAVAQAVYDVDLTQHDVEIVLDGGDASAEVEPLFIVDKAMSDTSNNVVANRTIKQYVDGRTTDYIVEQGATEDGWTYRKWNSGIAECWGKRIVQFLPNTPWSSGGFYTEVDSNGYAHVYVRELPEIFSSVDSAQLNTSKTEFIMIGTIQSISTTQIGYFLLSTQSSEIILEVDVNISVKGRWK